MRRPSKSGSPKCLKYKNVLYIRNFWDIRKPWERFQCWVRIIYFLTVPDDHTVVSQSVLFCTHFPSLFVFMYIFFFVFLLFICEHCLFVLIFIDCFFPLDPAPGDWQFVCCSLFLSLIYFVFFHCLFVVHSLFVLILFVFTWPCTRVLAPPMDTLCGPTEESLISETYKSKITLTYKIKSTFLCFWILITICALKIKWSEIIKKKLENMNNLNARWNWMKAGCKRKQTIYKQE